ncbi:MAG: hypothetical protein ACYDCQ_12340 [Dehalococcoidia bacterium]
MARQYRRRAAGAREEGWADSEPERSLGLVELVPAHEAEERQVVRRLQWKEVAGLTELAQVAPPYSFAIHGPQVTRRHCQ